MTAVTSPDSSSLDNALPVPPRTIIVELTNVCDLKCPLCTTYVGMHRPRGFMQLDLFKQIIDELQELDPKPTISMNMSGEPLLHREVDRFVAYAAKHGHATFISTNTTHLNESMSERLVSAGLSSIYLCVDGATAESHEAYRVGSTFEKVRAHCAGLLEVRRRLGRSNPFVTIQTLLTGFSENEMEDVLEWAWGIGADEVFFKSLSLGSNTSDEQKRNNLPLVPTRAEFQRNSMTADTPCRYPSEHTLVYWNGDLGVCCVDFNNMASLSGVQQAGGLLAALRSNTVQQARLRGQQTGYDLCRRCQSVGAGFRGIRVPLGPWRNESGDQDEPCWSEVLDERVGGARS